MIFPQDESIADRVRVLVVVVIMTHARTIADVPEADDYRAELTPGGYLGLWWYE